MTNEELLQRYMGGDASALERLYEQNIGLIKRIAEKCLMDFGHLPQGAEIVRKLGYYVGAGLIVQILRGSHSGCIRQLELDKHSTYGLMREGV